MSFNIEGITSKLKDDNFVSFISRYDIVCLVETFIDSFTSNIFPHHECYLAPATKLLSHKGRKSGGVLVLVRNVLLPYVQKVTTDIANCVVLKVNKDLFNTFSDVCLVCTYVNCVDSPFYNISDFDNGIAMVEECLLRVVEKYGDIEFILCGDFNSRIADSTPSYHDQLVDSVWHLEDRSHTDFSGCKRVSEDVHENEYGKYFLNLCSNFDLYVLNGMCSGDAEGAFTYISPSGCSVIDYFILSRSLSHLPVTMSVLERTDSKHMPLCCILRCPVAVPHSETFIDTSYKLKWSDDKVEEFEKAVRSKEASESFEKAKVLIDSDLNKALEMFMKTLSSVADCLKTRVGGKKSLFHNTWFDKECYDLRCVTRKALRIFRINKLPEDRTAYCVIRKQYKKLLLAKETDYKHKCRLELEENIHDSKSFWTRIKKFTSKSRQTANISNEQWLEHFQKVFESREILNEQECARIRTNLENTHFDDRFLNEDISLTEVREAIGHLKGNKAAGPDGIIPEVFIHSSEIISSFLVLLFNKIFSSGQYPLAWTEALIQPIHKRGDINLPDNYRGISLLNICAKLYSHIIDKRLSRFVEDNDILGEIQAGFRKDHSTIDYIFSLFSLIQKHLLKKQKFCVAFIDFQKAFDLSEGF